MRSSVGVASKMFEVLSKEGINIKMIGTSEIKISVVLEDKYMELAVRTLHAAFGLRKRSFDILKMCLSHIWLHERRHDREAEGAPLLGSMCQKRIVGSNPTVSAIF